MSKFQPPSNLPEPSGGGRLDSWKEIAAYLKRDERTVRRWEEEGLPVHRKVHKKQASVFAYPAEIDAWWNEDRQRLAVSETTRTGKPFRLWLLSGLVAAGVLALIAFGLQRFLGRPDFGTIRSLAVLPLENLSRDPDQEYFADGMTEALTTQLAQISALKVISHTSVVQYKGTKKSLPQIAHELNVDAVVEGAVERSGDRVEINVQLILAPADRHLWAKSYERGVGDVLDLQREVTQSITAEMKTKLTSPERIRLSSSRSVDAEAYEDYLKGKFLLSTYTEADTRKGIAYFQQAIQKDPNYALAYSGMAEAYITLSQPWVGALPPKQTLPQAKTAAAKALEIDDTLAEAHSALAHVIEIYDWDWHGAEKHYTRALELNPNDAMAHFWYGEYLQAMARNDEGFAQMRQAIADDPLNAGPVAELGTQFYMARQYDDAIRVFQKAFEVEPDYGWAHTGLGWVYAKRKMYSEAIAELGKGDDMATLASLGKVFGDSGRKQEARKILAELRQRSKRRYVSPYLVALVQVGLGERNQAIKSLEEGCINRDQWMMFLNVDPGWDGLRSDARFRNLLQRVDLLQFSPRHQN